MKLNKENDNYLKLKERDLLQSDKVIEISEKVLETNTLDTVRK